MASEDVIELGSSDDETQPLPKKKKPTPNAMVHIPTKLPGVTIKPAKFNLIPAPRISSNPSKPYNVPKGILSKPIMIGKSNISFDYNINKPKPIPATRVPILKNLLKSPRPITSAPHSKNLINPVSIARHLKKPELVIKKLANRNKKPKTPAGVPSPKVMNNLPHGITIKPLANVGLSGSNTAHNAKTLKQSIGEVLTVEIDDEEGNGPSVGSLQWYLRPEEQGDNNLPQQQDKIIKKSNDNVGSSMEEQNNKEPESERTFVEITIEDSPVKPLNLRERSEIGKELPITIDDSPVKLIKNRNKHSDIETELNIVPQSKKKLEYPKSTDVKEDREVVEIEIDIVEDSSLNCKKNEAISNEQDKTISSDQDQIKPEDKNEIFDKETYVINNTNECGEYEFHPIYQDFIDLCFSLENSEDMKKIVEKKIKAYYKQCPKEYVESEEFTDMVFSKIVSMKASPGKMYLFIKDVVDDLNLQRKMTKTIVLAGDTSDNAFGKMIEGITGGSVYDAKRQKQIRKLERTIKKLHRAIQKLEEQEVDFDDDEDSVYLLTERYKERLVRVHAKFCQLTSTKMPSEPLINLEVRHGQPAGPVRKLEKWINKKVPIGKPLPFPDFHDVVRCVREANEEDHLGWSEVEIMEEARDLFTRCGKKLQRRRQENEWRLAVSRISQDVDPAIDNVALRTKLDENRSMAAKNETDIFKKYVDKQNQLKLVAEEIGDKEAEESPVESEEEELVEDNNSLVEKQKRKERLKRLLHEQHQKTEEKENDFTKEENTNIKDNENKTKVQENSLTKSDEGYDAKKTGAIENKDEILTTNKTRDSKVESDGNEVESDIDELHLLQKLHSENESEASLVESSDSDTPISISDSFESDSDTENKKPSFDVISIENSSYSESEATADGFSNEYCSKKTTTESLTLKENESIIENILLASSDEDTSNNVNYNKTCVNLKDENESQKKPQKTGITVKKDLFENNNALNIGGNLCENDNTNVRIEEEGLSPQGNDSVLKAIKDCSTVEKIKTVKKEEVISIQTKAFKTIERNNIEVKHLSMDNTQNVTLERNDLSVDIEVTYTRSVVSMEID